MAKVNPILAAQLRTVTGRQVKHLRREGILPATIYGKGFEPVSVQVIDKDLETIFDEVGESGLVDLELDGKKVPVLFRNPQYHPITGSLIHVDCYKVNLKEKIITSVPIELIGEAPAVKAGNLLVPVTNEVEVEALPADLPEKIEIDISALENVDSQITVGDIKIDGKYEIKTDAEQLIVKVEAPKEEVIEEPATETVVAPAMEQKSPEELAAAEEKKKEEK
ncbi:MAG TPA: 50S ribosomal protein L25 [Patescibacteria group bacterium]